MSTMTPAHVCCAGCARQAARGAVPVIANLYCCCDAAEADYWRKLEEQRQIEAEEYAEYYHGEPARLAEVTEEGTNDHYMLGSEVSSSTTSAISLEIDKESGCVYVRLQDGEVASTQELRPDVMLDLDAAGNVLGMELLAPRISYISNPQSRG